MNFHNIRYTRVLQVCNSPTNFEFSNLTSKRSLQGGQNTFNKVNGEPSVGDQSYYKQGAAQLILFDA